MLHGQPASIKVYVLHPYELGTLKSHAAEVLLPDSTRLSLPMKGQPLPDGVRWRKGNF